MSGSFGEMGNLLKQAQQMQRELDRVRKELGEKQVEGSAGGGVVRVKVDGNGKVTDLVIDDGLIKGDPGLLRDTILAAVQEGIKNANALRETEMSKVTSGLNLPGIF